MARKKRKKKKGKGRKKIARVMGEFKRKTLKSSSGHKVTKKSQAVAIALSQARKAGANIPKKRGKAFFKSEFRKSKRKA